MRDQILSHCSTCSGNSKSLENCEPESMGKCPIYMRKVYWAGHLNDHMCVYVCSVMSHSLLPHGLTNPPGSLSMEFSRQEYWDRLPFPFPVDLHNLGNEPLSPALAGGFFTTEPPGKHIHVYVCVCIYILGSHNIAVSSTVPDLMKHILNSPWNPSWDVCVDLTHHFESDAVNYYFPRAGASP